MKKIFFISFCTIFSLSAMQQNETDWTNYYKKIQEQIDTNHTYLWPTPRFNQKKMKEIITESESILIELEKHQQFKQLPDTENIKKCKEILQKQIDAANTTLEIIKLCKI